jgi:glyoxylase-like metal-dependent hydrolase (beta-lactamase superfamily II)
MDADSDDHIQHWSIGRVRVTSVPEFARVPRDGAWLFPDIGDVDLASHRQHLAPGHITDQGELVIAIQTFVIDTGTQRIIVDTCVGNDKPREVPDFSNLSTDFLARLTRAGYPPETIDIVLCTHMHVDHCGWNTRLDDGAWVPTFPNARYLFGRSEIEFWSNDGRALVHDEIYADSIEPILAAGLVDIVDPPHQICEEVSLFPTPGHTPGHCSVAIRSEGHEAFVTGDMIHHPLQFREPDLCTGFCYDKDQTRATRRQFIAQVSETPALVLGTHFPNPTGGNIATDGSFWQFRPVKKQ